MSNSEQASVSDVEKPLTTVAGVPVEDLKANEEAETDPQAIAARVYNLFINNYEMNVRKLSKKGLFRVLDALVKVPLVELNYTLSDVERNVYIAVDRMLHAKELAILNAISLETEKAEQEKEKENGEQTKEN